MSSCSVAFEQDVDGREAEVRGVVCSVGAGLPPARAPVARNPGLAAEWRPGRGDPGARAGSAECSTGVFSRLTPELLDNAGSLPSR